PFPDGKSVLSLQMPVNRGFDVYALFAGELSGSRWKRLLTGLTLQVVKVQAHEGCWCVDVTTVRAGPGGYGRKRSFAGAAHQLMTIGGFLGSHLWLRYSAASRQLIWHLWQRIGPLTSQRTRAFSSVFDSILRSYRVLVDQK